MAQPQSAQLSARPSGVRERLKAHSRPDNLATNDRAAMPRVITAFATAGIAAYWIGPLWALAWLVAVIIHERVVNPFLIAKIITPNYEARPHVAEWTIIGMSVFGALLYTLAWAAAWAAGGHEFSFFGGVMICATLIHALTYLSRSPMAFAMGTVPALGAGLALILFSDRGAPSWLMIASIAQVLFISVIAMRDRKALSQKVIDYRADKKSAEQANRAKTNFLASMSHELRTPLNAVIGFAEILEEDLRAGAAASPEDAARISRAGKSLLHMIDNVLDLAKIESGRVELRNEPVEILALLTDVAAQAHHIAKANANHIELNVEPGMGALVLDSQRLSQCALNIVANACKFTKQGQVTIVATKRQDEEGVLLSIAVIDTGIGIKEADQARLFQPFGQVDDTQTRSHDGSGLGLVIARRLAQVMGGDVTVMSRPGRGSTFTLTVRAQRVNPAAMDAPRAVA